MTKRNHQLFFSYRKVDANFVRSIANWVRASGITVWLDEDTIPLEYQGTLIEGEEWRDYVRNGIQSCDYILLFTNTEWVNSAACRWECDEAISARGVSSAKILHVCVPESPEVFIHYSTLRSIPTLNWTTEGAFAQFLEENCGLSLDTRYSPDTIRQAVSSWTITWNKLTSIPLPTEAHVKRGASGNKDWPVRSMLVVNQNLCPQVRRVGIKLAENPFQTFLSLRIPELGASTSDLPRDEQIQQAYRGLARSFVQGHKDFAWAGTHQFWLDKYCHFSLSYVIPAGHYLGDAHKDIIERLYSLQWRDSERALQGEVLLTFHFVPESPQDEAEKARFALFADAVAAAVYIPKNFRAHRFDWQIHLLRGGMIAAITILLWLGQIPSDKASLALVFTVIGWLAGESTGFLIFPRFRKEQRSKVFVYGTWALLFSLLWPIILCVVALSVFPGWAAHPVLFGVIMLIVATGKAMGSLSSFE